MTYIQERGSTHVYHVNRMSKEEMDHMISLCVHAVSYTHLTLPTTSRV